MAGRRKKDEITKEVTGAKQRPEPTVHVPAQAPPMPQYFKDDARLVAVWVEVVTDMDRLNILARTDSGTVEAYCITLERIRRLQAEIMREGEVYESRTANGPKIYKNPKIDILQKCVTILKQYAIEMGCTPASRSKVPSLLQADLFDRKEGKNSFAGFN